ncbi:hypothetical protein HK101_004458, partial [Irineochytrium annulatum]
MAGAVNTDASEDANKARNLTITTSDNVRLGAWHILPSLHYRTLVNRVNPTHTVRGDGPAALLIDGATQDLALRSRPVFLYFHGNAGNRASPKRIETYRNFAEKLNVNVVAIDYRGFGDSEGTPSEEGLARDARAAWDWLVKEKEVPPSNICLVGHSLGTGVATRLAHDLAQDHIEPRALILQAPYSSIPEVAFEFRTFQILPILQPVAYLSPALHKFMQVRILDKFDTLSRLRGLTCEVVIIHGRLDREIPCHHSRRLFTECRRAHLGDEVRVRDLEARMEADEKRAGKGRV